MILKIKNRFDRHKIDIKTVFYFEKINRVDENAFDNAWVEAHQSEFDWLFGYRFGRHTKKCPPPQIAFPSKCVC